MNDIKTASVETLPIWNPTLIEPHAQKEIAFMKRHYDDVESIISATKKIDWCALPVFAFRSDVGTYEKTPFERWDEDRQRMHSYSGSRRPYEGDVGLIQQAFEAAARQSQRTGEHIFLYHHQHLEMTPPCDLDIDIQGARCRLLWGLRDLNDQCAIETYEFDFVMCDRQFTVCARHDYHADIDPDGNGGIEYLQVVLFRGEPFDSPIWGTQLETKNADVPDKAENRAGA